MKKSEEIINGAGEGMKVGIIALLRHNINVTYYTNKEIWDWCFHNYPDPDGGIIPGLLSINLSQHEPGKAKTNDDLSEDVKEARRASKTDTTVIVQAHQHLDIDFSDYLFLVNPPAETLLKTDLGTILIGDKYRSKIFVKGIFVEKRGTTDPPALIYGVDFSKAPLDRDRRSLMSGKQVASTLARIWNELIIKDNGDAAAKRYLKLLLAEDNYLETLQAKDYLSCVSAIKVHEALRSLHSEDSFFYNAEDINVPEAYSHISVRANIDCSYNSRLSFTNSRINPTEIIRNIDQIQSNSHCQRRKSATFRRCQNFNSR